MKKIIKRFCIIVVATLLLCGAYYLGTTQTERSEIPKDSKEQYIDTDSIESIVETKDGFEVYMRDGNIFFFDCIK